MSGILLDEYDVDAWTLKLGTGVQINLDSVTRGVEGIKNYLIQKCVLSNSHLSESTRLNSQMMFIRRANIIKYFAPIGAMIQI